MKNRTILFAAALLLAVSPMIAGNPVSSETQPNQAVTPEQCGVTHDQIYMYMLEQGYVVTSMCDITGCCNVKAKTVDGRAFTVYVADGVILGHDDSDF